MGRHLSGSFVVYALGGGRGHAVRGSVLTAALRRLGAEATVLVRASEAPQALGVPFEVCPRPQSAAQLREHVLQLCARLEAHTLVLDTFPEGLLGELAGSWSGPRRVGLLRCRRDADSGPFGAAVASLDAAVDLEPHLQWLPDPGCAHPLGPITRLESTAAVGSSPIDVLVVASEPALRPFADRLVRRLSAADVRVALAKGERLCGPATDTAAFPIPPEFLAARVVVGPAGFNLTYEAQTLRTWHIALPRARSHDDQHRRAAAMARIVAGPDAVERLALALHLNDVRAPQLADLVSADALAAWVADQS